MYTFSLLSTEDGGDLATFSGPARWDSLVGPTNPAGLAGADGVGLVSPAGQPSRLACSAWLAMSALASTGLERLGLCLLARPPGMAHMPREGGLAR